jgi:hypothetical protein
MGHFDGGAGGALFFTAGRPDSGAVALGAIEG